MAELTGTRVKMVATWVVLLAVVAGPASVAAQGKDRPTIEDRFGDLDNSVYMHATVMTQIRNDFYDSVGVGADAGYYFNQSLGIEARWLYLFSSLSRGAQDVKRRTGLTPDARPQEMMMSLGLRYSLGYGKVLVGGSGLLHFDPQFVVHGGIAIAEKRVLPTAKAGLSMLGHFKWGLQGKLDLMVAFQMEDRQRGWVPSFGFVPVLGIGWNGNVGDIVAFFSSLVRGGEDA